MHIGAAQSTWASLVVICSSNDLEAALIWGSYHIRSHPIYYIIKYQAPIQLQV